MVFDPVQRRCRHAHQGPDSVRPSAVLPGRDLSGHTQGRAQFKLVRDERTEAVIFDRGKLPAKGETMKGIVSLLKLLIVDDDLASLELMSEVFTSLNAEVWPISDSEKALALVNQQRFDGIFLDLSMPSPDGFRLACVIRKSSWNKSTPIVIVTGLEDRQAMQEVFSLGATFFLQKPVDRQKLITLYRTVRGGMLENRRRYVRVPLQTDVTCTAGSRTTNGVSWNLSQGGIQVETGQLQTGETVRLSFRLPVLDKVIDVEGVVVWSKESRQGIQFTKVSARDQESISAFVDAVDK